MLAVLNKANVKMKTETARQQKEQKTAIFLFVQILFRSFRIWFFDLANTQERFGIQEILKLQRREKI